jgi:hypothetical protein
LRARDQIVGWLEAQPGIRPVVLGTELLAGGNVPVELERHASRADAAVVLMTEDERERAWRIGPRRRSARPNVLIELGWFWARVGLGRTFVLRQRRVPAPSDLGGVFHETFRDDPLEAETQLDHWLKRLAKAPPSAVTEVVQSASTPNNRTAEYTEVHAAARRKLLITGVGMINVRQRLPALLARLGTETELELTFLTLDPRFVGENQDLVDRLYRPGIAEDLHQFVADLRREVGRRGLQERVKLFEFSAAMTFVTTVADLDEWGSMMLMEAVIPAGDFDLVERPRLLLRRRHVGGLYDRMSGAAKAILREAREVEL